MFGASENCVVVLVFFFSVFSLMTAATQRYNKTHQQQPRPAQQEQLQVNHEKFSEMPQLKLALDWTPNSNHTGFYVALSKGWFKAEGIDLVILPPSDDYTTNETPGRRLMKGEVDLAIAPTESCISCWTSDHLDSAKPITVAAVLSKSASAICTMKSSGIMNPAELDGKRYASYEGRFEMAIIKNLIKKAGGSGEIIEVLPEKLKCFDAVLNDDCQATWIFEGWEGVEAKMKGIELNSFVLEDYGVPYGYSPVLLASSDLCSNPERVDVLKKFLAVSERGWQFTVTNPVESVDILLETSNHPSLHVAGRDFLIESQKFISTKCLGADGRWGRMEESKWDNFFEFLFDNECLTTRDGSIISR